ncbi:hypothetical protein BC941DRAFT_378630 [Chlamydoabsidia padenii]|nr:hypothetical protein BC941DRAFT_378630 [Chlamydoabsidia padenii]
MSLRAGSAINALSSSIRGYATVSKKAHPPRRSYLHEQYASLVKNHRVMFVFQHNNLTVKEFTQIRQDLSSTTTTTPCKLTVLRAGIMASVLRTTEFANLEPLVTTGPTCVLTTDDDVSLKSVTDILIKNKKMVLLGGKMDQTLLTQQDVIKIIQLPGLDHVRAELVGAIEAPARQLLRTLEAPANQVHSILDRRI